MTPAQVLAAVERVEFTASWLRRGYDCRRVDELLAAVVQAVRRETDVSAVVDRADLLPRRFRAGYRVHEVDEFLACLPGPGGAAG